MLCFFKLYFFDDTNPMALTAKQFNYLNEMGISLWQQKTSQSETEATKLAQNSHLAIDLVTLKNSQLFQDVLAYFQLSEGEFKVSDNRIQFDFFDWCFSVQDSVSYANHQLITPDVTSIAQSVSLKKQLWQQLQRFSTN